jgi:esterase/lipase superfamily enzyme
MITNRNRIGGGFGPKREGLTYWGSDGGDLQNIASWRLLDGLDAFTAEIVAAAGQFPEVPRERQEDQRHVTVFVHGYNNTWQNAAARYQTICSKLFDDGAGLGLCVLFDWPSDGQAIDYFPDRIDARNSAQDLATVLTALYEVLSASQEQAMKTGTSPCRAKTSIIAHSMGNYALQKAMQLTWTRKNQPLLVSLISELIMVAADVDNDLFKSGESVDKSDGDAIANLSYRVTALYTGRDSALGASAGLKHFGKRRLGRSGLDPSYPVPDNVWDFDCSALFASDEQNIHSAYFAERRTIELMRQILRGVDRNLVKAMALTL